jgi:hypothetical protein
MLRFTISITPWRRGPGLRQRMLEFVGRSIESHQGPML